MYKLGVLFLAYVKKREKETNKHQNKSCFPMLSLVLFSSHLLSGETILESSSSQTVTQFKVIEIPKVFFLCFISINVYYIRN